MDLTQVGLLFRYIYSSSGRVFVDKQLRFDEASGRRLRLSGGRGHHPRPNESNDGSPARPAARHVAPARPAAPGADAASARAHPRHPRSQQEYLRNGGEMPGLAAASGSGLRAAGSCDRVCRRPRRGRYDDMLWSDVPRRSAPPRIARMIAPPERRYDLLTLGETLMRLSPPANQRLDQARLFEIGVGGSELNVGCLLARLGRRVA